MQFIHGLLQTEDYARAVILISNASAPTEEIERRVSLRMQRQRLLTQPDAPDFWAVLDEAALRRPPDGRAVTRAQLEYLLEVTDLPNSPSIIPSRRARTPRRRRSPSCGSRNLPAHVSTSSSSAARSTSTSRTTS